MPPNFVFDPVQIVRLLPAITTGSGLIVTLRVALVVPHRPKDVAVIVAVPLNDKAQLISPVDELIIPAAIGKTLNEIEVLFAEVALYISFGES